MNNCIHNHIIVTTCLVYEMPDMYQIDQLRIHQNHAVAIQYHYLHRGIPNYKALETLYFNCMYSP
jgi:uncharacterized protein Usg